MILHHGFDIDMQRFSCLFEKFTIRCYILFDIYMNDELFESFVPKDWRGAM